MKKFFSKDGYLSFKSIGLIVSGSAIYSFAMNVFILPAGMYSGGILGIAQLIRALGEFLGVKITSFDAASVIYYVINLPLMFFAYKIGKAFFYRTFLCTSVYTVFLAAIPIPSSPLIENTLTACLTGGILSGIGIGLTLLSGGCGGGEEIISVYLTKKHSTASVGKITLIINIFVFGCCAVFFDWTVALYSIIYAVFSSIALDKIHFQNITADLFIISRRNDIDKLVFETVKRGVTKLEGNGGYTGERINVYLVAVSKKEALLLKRELQQKAPDAFVVIHDNIEVQGNFKMRMY